MKKFIIGIFLTVFSSSIFASSTFGNLNELNSNSGFICTINLLKPSCSVTNYAIQLDPNGDEIDISCSSTNTDCKAAKAEAKACSEEKACRNAAAWGNPNPCGY